MTTKQKQAIPFKDLPMHLMLDSLTGVIKQQEMKIAKLENLIVTAPKLLEALKKAREYVVNCHSILASVTGHNETVVKPDLDSIDEVIAKAEAKK